MAIFNSYVGLPEGNVGKTIMNHPPVITMFNMFFRWYVYHSQSWVVYGIALPTLIRDLLSTYQTQE